MLEIADFFLLNAEMSQKSAASPKTLSALCVISSRLPIGVGTRYNFPGFDITFIL
jgi:hypothetical protein